MASLKKNKVHPRLHHHPYHKDYMGLASEFRPFTMFADNAEYRSEAVNTDKFGLREQYDAQGNFIDMEALSDVYEKCNIFIGGSAAFGVDATSDKKTIPSFLNEADVPCINLGVRGATSQQELILFMLFKQYLPQIEHVFIFSGFNNVSWASLPGSKYYKGFGGVFYGEDLLYRSFWAQQYEAVEDMKAYVSRHRLYRIFDRLFLKSRLIRSMAKLVFGGKVTHPSQPFAQLGSFSQKLSHATQILANDLHSWSIFAKGLNFSPIYILQPIFNWTEKKCIESELACCLADEEENPSIALCTDNKLYLKYREDVKSICRDNDIAFLDANEWLQEHQYQQDDIFTCACHYTDRGNEIVASHIKKYLDTI